MRPNRRNSERPGETLSGVVLGPCRCNDGLCRTLLVLDADDEIQVDVFLGDKAVLEVMILPAMEKTR
jgi:hypothetical protein